MDTFTILFTIVVIIFVAAPLVVCGVFLPRYMRKIREGRMDTLYTSGNKVFILALAVAVCWLYKHFPQGTIGLCCAVLGGYYLWEGCRFFTRAVMADGVITDYRISSSLFNFRKMYIPIVQVVFKGQVLKTEVWRGMHYYTKPKIGKTVKVGIDPDFCPTPRENMGPLEKVKIMQSIRIYDISQRIIFLFFYVAGIAVLLRVI